MRMENHKTCKLRRQTRLNRSACLKRSKRLKERIRRLKSVICRLFAEICYVLFPRGCAGCEKPDSVLCGECAKLLEKNVAKSFSQSCFLWEAAFSCGFYRGRVRKMILEWKDKSDEEVTKYLKKPLKDLVRKNGFADKIKSQGEKNIQITVVPVPSSPSSLHRRGRFHTLKLCDYVAQGVKENCPPGVNKKNKKLLYVDNVKKSVENNSARSRSNRLKGHIHVKNGQKGNHSARVEASEKFSGVILVDDILTTGATVRSCSRALKSAGYTPLTAVTIACGI